jgi:anti-anti-sigma regulatory factor
MSLQVTQAGPNALATLDGELTIQNVGTLREELAAAGCQSVDIDLSGVTEIDTAGLQWLLMAKRMADGVRFVNHSPAVIHMLELCHLEQLLGESPADAAQETAH